MLPGGIGEMMIPAGVMDLKRTAARVAQNVREVVEDKKTTRQDVENDTQHRSIFYTIRDDPALPAAEKEPLRLQREGNFLVVAASDSPARAIHITHFYLMFRPECMAKLREELRPLGPAPRMQELNELPYLNAVFLEGTRLMFGLARRIFRIAPEDAIVYKDYVIPPGTNVATSTLCVHSDEEVFPEPFVFKPERWLGADAKELRNKYHMTFGSKSPRSCLGIHLAEAEMKFAIAAVVRFDMELFQTGLGDVEYRHDYQMAHGELGSKGVRAMVKGKLW
jgi:cytochrome P450